MEPIIRIDDLGKKYLIRHQRGNRYPTLRETISNRARRMVSRHGRRSAHAIGETSPTREEFWALQGITLSVNAGDKLGIIGRNGAGKTTLLKILSRITEPSTGRVEIRGRVASLLEVGTGFHPELTGRENIFLNGAILGMGRAEIKRKFAEIVFFSEVENFLDTPVKHYSSGMYVRLAFAVAAHLEPEILLVDEVLAVGDAAFQKKCLGKMADVSRQGRTILFVSHNLSAVSSLCDRCLLIDEGKIVRQGTTAEVTSFYQSSFYALAENSTDLSAMERYGTGRARFTSIKVSPLNADNSSSPCFVPGNDLKIELAISAHADIQEANVAVIMYDAMGSRLVDVSTGLQGSYLDLKRGQQTKVEFRLHDLLLRPGHYLLGLWLGQAAFSEDIDGITYVTSLAVEADVKSSRHSALFPGPYQCRFSQKIHPPSGIEVNKK